MLLNDVEKKLFFIIGCRRSGTTLLKTILSSHSDIYIPPETFFYTSIVRKYNLVSRYVNPDKLDYVLGKWWIRELGISKDNIQQKMDDSGRDSSDWNNIFLSMLGVLAEAKDAKLIGEKTPSHIDVADKLLGQFPSCRIIHIVRDPRAVLASCRSVDIGTNQAAGVIREWMGALRMHNKIRDSERYYWLRYEDLVSCLDKKLSEICMFLGVDFDESMLGFYNRKTPGFSVEQSHHCNTMRPIFTSSVDSWKTKIPKSDIALIEYCLAEEMKCFGYQCLHENILFPKFRYNIGIFCDFMHKNFIRRNKQIIKAVRAQIRLQSNDKL